MKPFLTAAWRHLAMVNFEVPPEVLQPLVPLHVELDQFEGRTLVSLVAFLFEDTKLRGVSVPFHANFEEVNLRFYVRRLAYGEERRAVVFIKEIVPLPMVALGARLLYNENYVAMPMRHKVDPGVKVSYGWKYRGRWNTVELEAEGSPFAPRPGSEEEFIAEHYWGYAKQRDGSTLEYRVDHPPWRVWHAQATMLDCDFAGLYGGTFAEYLSGEPSSVFLAEGSPVCVYDGVSV